ncbi:MAG: GMC oxidoreductase [Elainellaceae cyanobacterium]
MLIDAREVPGGSTLCYDICIVGGGPAGISIAREFIGKARRVCLLESGGQTINGDALTDSLRDGENIGRPYFSIRKLGDRGLGGNSQRWASSVRPLDALDFEKRDWVPYSGWPFSKGELMPYYRRASPLCGVGAYSYDTHDLVSGRRIEDPDFQPLSLSSDRLKTRVWQYDLPPLHWGKAYGSELKAAPNIDLYLYANAVEIEPNNDVKRVESLRVACVSGSQFRVSARVYILAAGGVEIPRLLLASNSVQRAGLGNQNDLVGRFFTEHPHYNRSASFIASRNHYPGLYSWKSAWRYGVRAGLSPSIKTQSEETLLNYTVRLDPSSHPFPQRQLAPSLGSTLSDIAHHANAAGRNNRVARRLQVRPAVQTVLDFLVMAEQAPNPISRIMLSPEKDRLGLHRVRLDWRLSALDRRTAVRMPQIIQEEIRRGKLGEVKIHLTERDVAWPEFDTHKGPAHPTLVGGWHFMGTTRMHSDPKQGVVDADCRVHGLSNLYIASSSLFPTVGYANPTLTVIALALRLADHVERQLLAHESLNLDEGFRVFQTV